MKKEPHMLTIGELAKRVGVRTSTLRYYEKEGLLQANGRSEAGYRLYHPKAEQRLRLIQRAQRVGFSLADIRTLLHAWEHGNLNDKTLIKTAETRYMTLEKQITELLVLQHELELFLQDLHQKHPQHTTTPFDELLSHICTNPAAPPTSTTILDWLRRYTGCVLASNTAQTIINILRHRHFHIWQENDAYCILVVGHDDEIGHALQQLAQLEGNCQVHTHPEPELTYNDEGYLFVARGENAFIFARFFLALEQETENQIPPPP